MTTDPHKATRPDDGPADIPAPTAPIPPAPPDPFDIAALRVTPEFMELSGVKKLLTTVPVGKPHPQEFFRVHPGSAFRDTFATLEWKEDGEFYILTPAMVPELSGECINVALHTAINRQGVIRLIPAKLPGSDGRVLEAHRSLHEAVERAMSRWTRMRWNRSRGAYDIFEASLSIPDPEWPEGVTFQDLLKIGFRDKLISTRDHPLIAKLRGVA
jgi:hypothetical protein